MATKKKKAKIAGRSSSPKVVSKKKITPLKTRRPRLAKKHPSSPFIILLTGVPGTGKTTMAKTWCEKEDWAYLGLNDLVEAQKLYSSIDEEDMSKVVRLSALETAANAWLAKQEGGAVVEGHLGCEISLKVSRVLVLRLNPNELAQRLEARGYTPSKVRENKMTELLDYCTVRAAKIYGEQKVFEQDTSAKAPEQNLAIFAQFAASEKVPDSFKPHVNWSDELFKEVDVLPYLREGRVHKV